MHKALALAPDDPYTYYYNALVFLRAGDENAALGSLAIAANKGYSRQMMAADPLLMELRLNPRFSAIISVG